MNQLFDRVSSPRNDTVIDAHRSWAPSTASTPRRALCMIDYRERSGGSSRSFLPRPRRQKGGSASAARSSVCTTPRAPLHKRAASTRPAPASSSSRRRTRRRTNIPSSRASPRRSTASRVLWKVLFGTRACCPPCGGPGNGHCVVASTACRSSACDGVGGHDGTGLCWSPRRRRMGIRAEREASPASASDRTMCQNQWPTEALAIAA